MSRRGWVLFLTMAFVWGVPYLLIKVAVEEMSPAMLVFARTALASLILLPVAAARGQLRPVLPYWRPVLAFAAIEIAVPWVLLNTAEQSLSSSLTGLLLAAIPLVGAVFAWLGLTGAAEDAVDRRRVLGLLLGLTGVAALVGFEVGGGDLWAVAMLGVVALCYAAGPVILTRWLSHLPGIGVIAVSLAVTAIAYLPFGLATAPSEMPSGQAVWSVIGLAVVCTAVAFLLFFALIAEVGPTRSTVITYLNPAVALLLGVALLDEKFTAVTALGFALILAGSYLATQRPKRAAEVPACRAPADDEAVAAPAVAEP